MKVFFLTSTLDAGTGWGRYAQGFLDQARKRLGPENVIAPEPESLASRNLIFTQPIACLLDALRLLKVARNCDVIHASTELMAPLALVLSGLSRKPYVVSICGTYGDIRTYSRSVRWLYRSAFSRADQLAVLSHFTEKILLAGVPEAHTTLVAGGFDPIAIGAERRAPSQERRILSVGALKPRKGFHTLIEALIQLKRSGLETRCDIVGPIESPDYHESLLRQAASGGLTEKELVIHGRVSQEELEDFYRRADLFVLASEHSGTAFEGLGLVYLEALACETPVIGCLESGAEDVIQDGVNGRLVPPGRPEVLAQAIGAILSDADLWVRLSLSARPSIAKFTWDAVGADMERAYLKALGNVVK